MRDGTNVVIYIGAIPHERSGECSLNEWFIDILIHPFLDALIWRRGAKPCLNICQKILSVK